jgi:GAF domain-containing protein
MLAEPQRLLYRRIEEGVRTAASPAQALEHAVDALGGAFGRYAWVGIYLVAGDELALGPWRGPAETAHVRIPVGQGVCGAAARSGKIENVPDVSQDPRYLACFTSTRSELVVPITHGALVYGEIDIDSDLPAAWQARRAAPWPLQEGTMARLLHTAIYMVITSD